MGELAANVPLLSYLVVGGLWRGRELSPPLSHARYARLSGSYAGSEPCAFRNALLQLEFPEGLRTILT